jgi:ribose/xylose/arabinose/galactoside ABC-type transport system permease subunit
VKDRGFLVLAGLIAAAIIGDVSLNGGRASIFLIHEIISLQEYLQFWH